MATTTINLGLSLDGLSNVDSTGKATGDVLEWNSVSGNWEAVTPSGGTPAGSNGEIQFNNSGAFGADSGLVWDNTNKRLGVGATPATNARLDVRAQGALSTDIAFRVRNSANTLDAFKVQGNNEVNLRSNLSLGLYAAGSTRKLYMVRDAETFGIDVDWSGAATTAARIVNSGSGANTALIVSSFNGSSNNAIFASNGDVVVSTGKLVVGNHTASAKLDVKAAGALSTDIAFRVRNSADTIDRLSLTGTAFSITTASRAEMSVTANAINFGLDNHNVVFTHASAGQVLQTQRSVGAAFGHLATLGLSNVETLTNGSTIFGSTIRGGVLTNVQNKMHFVCDKTKWGLDGVYSAGFQWFKGDQSGDAAFNTATLPSITTANRQMWLTPENSLLFFNTSGITFTTNTDSFQQYSADITAGNAAPHFRTENGDIIKLYRETTGIAAATFVANTGNNIKEDSTFDGYTMKQVVKALRNMGILA
jgi:hypothetical protein